MNKPDTWAVIDNYNFCDKQTDMATQRAESVIFCTFVIHEICLSSRKSHSMFGH